MSQFLPLIYCKCRRVTFFSGLQNPWFIEQQERNESFVDFNILRFELCSLSLPFLPLLFFSISPQYHHTTLSTFPYLKINKSFLNLTLPIQILLKESSAQVLSLCCSAHQSEFHPRCYTRTQRGHPTLVLPSVIGHVSPHFPVPLSNI